jgi:hypothetical protein
MMKLMKTIEMMEMMKMMDIIALLFYWDQDQFTMQEQKDCLAE